MKSHKSFVFRLYPNKEQEELMRKTLGCSRFVFNWALNLRKEHYEKTQRILSSSEIHKHLTELKKTSEYVWLSEVHSQPLQSAISQMDDAYRRFFKRQNSFPNFRKKSARGSFTHKQFTRVDSNERSIFLPNLRWLKARGSWNALTKIEFTKICYSTVSYECGKWYCSITVEYEHTVNHEHKFESCGIDIGVVQPLTVAYFKKGKLKSRLLGLEAKSSLEKKEHRRKKYQKQLARKQKGSKNRLKSKLKVEKAYQRERNTRKDFIEKTSNKLTDLFKVIKLEDLNIQRMTTSGPNKSNLNREMLRLGLGALIVRTQQKAKEKGGAVLFVDPRNTSRQCSCCNHISKLNRKSQAEFRCVKCGFTDNADRNAALNILRRKAA